MTRLLLDIFWGAAILGIALSLISLAGPIWVQSAISALLVLGGAHLCRDVGRILTGGWR